MKKLTIGTEALKAALTKLSLAFNKSSTLPILSNLYFKVRKGEVELITFDLELAIHYTCPCEADKEFEMLIPFEFLQKLVKYSKEAPLSIELTGARKVRITGADDEYNIGLEKVDDFPKLQPPPKKNTFKLDGNFIEWLNSAMLTVGKDDLRPAMTKACLDITTTGMKIVSTDANFLFTKAMKIESEKADQLLISPKVAKALEGSQETELSWHQTHISFKAGQVVVIARRHDVKYPDYKVVIPGYAHNLTINRSDFINALERSRIVADSSATILELKKEAGRVHLKTEDIDLERGGDISIIGAYAGESDFVAISAAKMLTLMAQIDFEEVRLHIHGSNKPVVISAEADADYLALLMPLMINQ